MTSRQLLVSACQRPLTAVRIIFLVGPPYPKPIGTVLQLACALETRRGTVVGQRARRDHGANPLIGVAYKAALLADWFGSNFGLSPAARARLASDPPPKHGKFDGLIGPFPGRGA